MVEAGADTKRLVRLYYGLRFVESLNFQLPVWLLFGHEYLGLSYFWSVMLLTMPYYCLSGFFQVPCGAWADRHGRRAAYLLGTACVIVGILPLLITKNPALLFAFAPFTAVGAALRQGSVEAIVSSFADSHSDVRYSDLTANGMSLFYIARVIASACGGALYAYDPRLPLVAVLVVELAAAFLATRLPEARRLNRSSTLTVPQLIISGTRALHAIRGGWAMLLLFFCICVAFEILWLGYQPTFDDRAIDSVTVGVAYSIFSLLSALGGQIVRRLLPVLSVNAVARLQLTVLGVTVLLLLTLPGWWVLVAIVPVQFAFGTPTPVLNTFIAERTPSAARATSLSFVDLVVNFAIAFGALVGGLLLDGNGPSAVFVAAGIAAVLMMTSSVLWPFHETATRGAGMKADAEPQPLAVSGQAV